ncbi:Reverse transcriptase [Phytophthora palmivora]|uniref:Reverse transcriptase n=1 Tax=Phytophthora palmivora TaxID=4796 RepID=A0A2P4WXP8_9STRA|nr:Reverse transcriptase [Phytophthora palmivora]
MEDADERTHLQLVSKIHVKLVKPKMLPNARIQRDDPRGAETLSVPGPECAPLPVAAKVFAVITRAQTQESEIQGVPMEPLEYQPERWRRIKVHQDKDGYLLQLKDFLRGNTVKLSHAQARKLAKVADDFVLDSREVLYRLSRSTRDRPRDMVDELRLVVPKALQPDILHYAHEGFQGGHQGITRTGKGRPQDPGPSPGNIEPRRPFEVVSMDFVTHLPKPWEHIPVAFSGYVLRVCHVQTHELSTAQDVAEVYEEQVFRRFGASSMLRHDQDPRFMSEAFTRFRELLGSKQRATLAYRPQANGQQERSVQTVVRSIRAYIAEADQGDWDDHAERLMFALNTSFDATRLDTPFFWKQQRDYSYARACAEDLQKKAKRVRSAEQTRKWKKLSERLRSGFAAGDAV